MKAENFCKLFIFALLNLTCFLLSTIFLTSTYNINDQSYFLNCDERIAINLKYFKHYQGICALFSFSLFSFITFVFALIILIKKDKMDSENELSNYLTIEINQIDINFNNNNNNLESERVIGFNNNNNNNQNKQIEEEEEDKIIKENKGLMNTIIISFAFSQIFYAIELFVLSSFHYKSKNFEKEYKCTEIKELTSIYTALLVVGYIFLFIYIIFYIYLLILYNKLGKSAKNRLDRFTSSKYCECLSDCIEKGCEKCTECCKSKTDEEIEKDNRINAERLQQSNEQKLEYLKKLEKYKKDLEELNTKIKNGNSNDNEITSLNLIKFNLHN